MTRPPPARGTVRGPVVTYRHDAAGSFREGGSYAAEDRTRRLQTADYTFGDAFEIGTGRALHGGAQNDELLDRRTADGFDRSEGDWSDEAELTAAGDFAAESRSEGEAHAEDRTAREYLDRRVTRTDYAADADGRRPPAGGVHDSVTVAREDTVDATSDSVATLAWGSLYAAAAPAGGEPAAAGSDWFTETLTTDWDEAAEFEIGGSRHGRSAAGNTSDTRTVTTSLFADGGRTVRAAAGGAGSVQSASHGVSLDVSDAGTWDYAHDLLFAVDPDGAGDLTGTERNRAGGSRTETRRRLEEGARPEDADVLHTDVLTHDFEHEATVTHLADDPGADGHVRGTETADREDAETHDRAHTRTRSDVPGETTVGAGDHGRDEVTALLAAGGGIVEELWTVGAAREEGGPGWISLTGGDGGGDGDGDGGGGPEVREEEALFEIDDALYTADMHGGEVMRAGPYRGGPTESVRISAPTTTLGFSAAMQNRTRTLVDRGQAAHYAPIAAAAGLGPASDPGDPDGPQEATLQDGDGGGGVDGGGGDDGDGWFDGRIDLVDDYGNWMADHSFGFYTWAGEGLRSGLNGVGVSDGALADASDATLLVGTTAAATAAVLVGKAAIAAGPAATAAYLATEVAESGFEYLTGIPVIFGLEDFAQLFAKRGTRASVDTITGGIDLGRNQTSKKDRLFTDLMAGRPLDDVDPDGVFDVVAHGVIGGRGIWNGDEKVEDAVKFADWLRRHADYHGQPVRLLACQAGKGPDSFAQRLADALDQIVLGPTHDICASPRLRGLWTIGDDFGDGLGYMLTFLPRR